MPFYWVTSNLWNSCTLESMTRCLFWVSEGKSSWSSALSPLLKKKEPKPNIDDGFIELSGQMSKSLKVSYPFIKEPFWKSQKAGGFFSKSAFWFSWNVKTYLFGKLKKNGWKITTYHSKFATPFFWVVFRGKKGSKLFFCECVAQKIPYTQPLGSNFVLH